MSKYDIALKWAIRAYLSTLQEYRVETRTLKEELWSIDAEKVKLYVR